MSAAALGKWSMKVGTRATMTLGGALFGTAFAVSGMGVAMHSLPLLYLGNVIAGVGYGCAYTPPIQALLEWFPDKRGLASGVVIAGFGSGALFFTPAMNNFIQQFHKLPTYLGSSLETVTEGGKLFSNVGGQMTEVVYATAADLAKLPFSGLSEGFYVVGSGNTGVGTGLMALGGIYAAAIMGSAITIKKPAAGYLPAGYTPPAGQGGMASVNVGNVMKVIKTNWPLLIEDLSIFYCVFNFIF